MQTSATANSVEVSAALAFDLSRLAPAMHMINAQSTAKEILHLM